MNKQKLEELYLQLKKKRSKLIERLYDDLKDRREFVAEKKILSTISAGDDYSGSELLYGVRIYQKDVVTLEFMIHAIERELGKTQTTQFSPFTKFIPDLLKQNHKLRAEISKDYLNRCLEEQNAQSWYSFFDGNLIVTKNHKIPYRELENLHSQLKKMRAKLIKILDNDLKNRQEFVAEEKVLSTISAGDDYSGNELLYGVRIYQKDIVTLEFMMRVIERELGHTQSTPFSKYTKFIRNLLKRDYELREDISKYYLKRCLKKQNAQSLYSFFDDYLFLTKNRKTPQKTSLSELATYHAHNSKWKEELRKAFSSTIKTNIQERYINLLALGMTPGDVLKKTFHLKEFFGTNFTLPSDCFVIVKNDACPVDRYPKTQEKFTIDNVSKSSNLIYASKEYRVELHAYLHNDPSVSPKHLPNINVSLKKFFAKNSNYGSFEMNSLMTNHVWNSKNGSNFKRAKFIIVHDFKDEVDVIIDCSFKGLNKLKPLSPTSDRALHAKSVIGNFKTHMDSKVYFHDMEKSFNTGLPALKLTLLNSNLRILGTVTLTQ